jgi:hypothetical protein
METKTTKKSAFYYHHSNINKVIEEAKQGACYIVALPFTLKSILRQKENYESSNISPCKNIIFKKSSKVITNLKFQHKPNIIFQKSSYKNRPIT